MPGYFASLFDPDQPRSFFGAPLLTEQFPPSDPLDALGATGPAAADAATTSSPAPLSAEILTYPDGNPVLNHEGWPMLRPATMDVQKNMELGKQIAPMAFLQPPEGSVMDNRDTHMYAWFSHGGPMDYQRPDGARRSGQSFRPEYTEVSSYNFGAVAAAAGYSRDDAMQAAGLYNRLRGNMSGEITAYGNKRENEENIKRGWQDATDGKWSR